jgi:hypothetical protein
VDGDCECCSTTGAALETAASRIKAASGACELVAGAPDAFVQAGIADEAAHSAWNAPSPPSLPAAERRVGTVLPFNVVVTAQLCKSTGTTAEGEGGAAAEAALARCSAATPAAGPAAGRTASAAVAVLPVTAASTTCPTADALVCTGGVVAADSAVAEAGPGTRAGFRTGETAEGRIAGADLWEVRGGGCGVL